MPDAIVTAFLLGLVSGLIPGPVITSVFTEIIQSGFSKALRIVFIALVMESMVGLISLVLLSSLPLPLAWFYGLSLVGAAILLLMALKLWHIKQIDTESRFEFTLSRIVMIIFTNGMLWMYWITVCVPRAILLGKSLFLGEYLFLVVVEAGWLVSTLLLAYLFSRIRKVLHHPMMVPVLFRIFALLFLWFALDMSIKAMHFFLR